MAKDMTKKQIIIVGGGISGLLATIKVCELGGEVTVLLLPRQTFALPLRPRRHECLHGYQR